MSKVRHFILCLRTGILKMFHSNILLEFANRRPCPLYQLPCDHLFQFLHRVRLDLQTLDLVLEGPDLAHQVGRFVRGDGAGDDGTGDTAGAAESHLGGNVDVGNVLVLALRDVRDSVKTYDTISTYEERQVQENSEGRGVGSEDDQLHCVRTQT
jgi:hypothetical protein